jgi:hypothetical protein
MSKKKPIAVVGAVAAIAAAVAASAADIRRYLKIRSM